MGTASIHEGVRRMRFSDLLDRTEAKELTQMAAAELLGINVRTFQRWAERYEAEGDDGHRPAYGSAIAEAGTGGGTGADAGAVPRQICGLHGEALPRADAKAAWLCAGLHGDEARLAGGGLGAESAEAFGAPQEAPTPAASWHAAAPGRVAPRLDRRSARDGPDRDVGRCDERDLLDAAGRGRRHGVDVPGLGRGDWRAWSFLCALHRSRQPRGRSERVFGTLQGRLPKDLRLAGIRTVETANAWLKAHYMAEHNAAFAIKAEQQGTAFVADRHQAWREALCVIEERTVANDNTIAWSGRRLQLPESRLRPHFVKAVVRVHEYPDATVSVFLGPHRLATFAANGQLISPDAPQPGSVLGAVKDKPLRARKRASLTAPARAAVEIARVGAEKRASSRTKKPKDG